jgi:hypothetical protein
MYLVFMSLCLVCEVIVYFFIPETRNIPIEEMASVFGEDQEVMVLVTNDGKDIVEKNVDVVVQEQEHVSASGLGGMCCCFIGYSNPVHTVLHKQHIERKLRDLPQQTI